MPPVEEHKTEKNKTTDERKLLSSLQKNLADPKMQKLISEALKGMKEPGLLPHDAIMGDKGKKEKKEHKEKSLLNKRKISLSMPASRKEHALPQETKLDINGDALPHGEETITDEAKKAADAVRSAANYRMQTGKGGNADLIAKAEAAVEAEDVLRALRLAQEIEARDGASAALEEELENEDLTADGPILPDYVTLDDTSNSTPKASELRPDNTPAVSKPDSGQISLTE